MQASTAVEREAISARSLITGEDFAAVTTTVLSNNPGMGQGIAEQIVEEALAFVATCAKFPNRRLRPSRVVDEGWHALILNTGVYLSLCDDLGRYVHHQPEVPDTNRHKSVELDRTKAVIAEAGYAVNAELWLGPEEGLIKVAADCEHSGGNGGCSGTCIDPQPN